MQTIKQQLKRLTRHKQIILKSRGNKAIRDALDIVSKSSGVERKKIIIPDQGGWLRYKDYPPKYGLDVAEVKTDHGIIDLKELEKISEEAAALLYQNPAGYIANQPIKDIYGICKRNGCRVILDVTGCIGDDELCDGRYADIMLGSFGEHKPVNLGYGGFISVSDSLFKHFGKIISDVKEDFEHEKEGVLQRQLSSLKERLDKWYAIAEQTKKDFKDMDIIHPGKKGINVAVRFSDVKEKHQIIDYCFSHDLEYTVCPRYIRVLDDAISIEIKRC